MMKRTENLFVDEDHIAIITIEDERPLSVVQMGRSPVWRWRDQVHHPRRAFFPVFIRRICSVGEGSG